jgi:F420-dependent oxidoreductase-like protein
LPEIRFGVVIPQGWSYSLIPSTHEHEDAREDGIQQYNFSKKIAEAADNSSFDSIYTYDHFLPYYASSAEKNFFECFTLLSTLAAITRKVKIGQDVICNSYRNPALIAKMLSTLDVISNGRVELGLGAGWNEDEHRQYGYDFPSALTRIKQLDESLSIIKAMWTEEKGVATFSGKYFSIKNAICNPKPIQKPHPIIMVGGAGEKYLLRVVAKHADRYNHPSGSAEVLKRKISVIKEHCGVIGRDYKQIEYSVLISCLIRETEEEIKEKIKQLKRISHGMQQVEEAEFVSTIGTPEAAILALNRYIDVGVTHFILDFIGLDERTIRLFDSKVIRRI